MKYIVAVSGGVDSVVLLDMLAKAGSHELIIAHFDHGIRGKASRDDARFVEGLGAKYRIECEIGHGNLNSAVSEEVARIKRYEFLKEVAKQHDAQLVTAHHQDDLVESIAINLVRGTGWRGLAVFGDSAIERPLLRMRKSDIYEYALGNSLEWVEDETNQTGTYLRNRLRRKLYSLDGSARRRIIELYESQLSLKNHIDGLTTNLPLTSRYFLTMIDQDVALELLRALLATKSLSLTRPQRQRLLLAIKTARAGDRFQAGGGITVQFSQREFIVNQPL